MALNHHQRYVNGMRNVAWLAGFLRKRGDEYLIQQNNNEAHAIPIVVRDNIKMPPEFMPVEATCAIEGVRADDEQACILRVTDLSRPSVRSMPPLSTWVKGASPNKSETTGDNITAFRPFASQGIIKRDYIDGVKTDVDATPAELALAELFRSSGHKLDSSVGRNANKVFLAGYIGATRFVEPNEHQQHGYVEIYLHQHKEPERAIPVRLYHPDGRIIMKDVKKGCPAAFNGQMRMKILPDDDGNIRSRSLHVRVSDVLVAVNGKDILMTPDWWGDLFRSGMKERAVAAAQAIDIQTLPGGGITPIGQILPDL